MPRNFATSSALLSCDIPSNVARIMLIAELEPNDFEEISSTPANSSTARTGPQADTPEPATAGRNITRPPPCTPITS